MVGGRLLNIFTEFYLLDDDDDASSSSASLDYLDENSPKWIGAWWLGFLLILVLRYDWLLRFSTLKITHHCAVQFFADVMS